MNSIPANALIRILPSVLAAGGNPLSLNSIFLTNDSSIPIGTVQPFSSYNDVAAWFGAEAIESILAGVYFNGYENAISLPSTLYFSQYNESAVSAYLRSGSVAGVALADLQALSGTLIIPINGATVTSANINFAAATSFSNAAALMQAGLQTAGGVFTGQATIDNGSGSAGNTLTITTVTSGAIHVGDTVVGAGIAGGTTIAAFVGGTGGLGTYTLSGAAQHVTPTENITVTSTATVAFDSQRQAFVISSPTLGANSTIGFATGTLAAGVFLQAVQGAVLSQGAAAADPADALNTIVGVTQNWALFMTVWEPAADVKIGFAQWVQTQQKRFGYVCWDSTLAVTTGSDPSSFAGQCMTGQYDGIWPQWEPATDAGNGRKAALICGITASIDFDATQGRLAYSYKEQPGLLPDVTNQTVANTLQANGYNFYGAYATAAQQFTGIQPGSTPGAYVFFDPFVDQIWLNGNLQLAGMVLMSKVRFLPYNAQGYNTLRNTLQDPINQAVTAGVIQAGVTLSNLQKTQINASAGAPIADVIQSTGWYLQILDADPTVRARRGSPPCTLWYTDGGSIRIVDLASIAVL